MTLEAYPLNRYLITYLEGQEYYQLVFGGNQNARAPNYDITHFISNVDSNLPILSTAALSRV